ncbi:MAG: polyprenyl synthetase family protein [Chloroflexota bacterium]|nr:MAG: polyprenyl synthetase family protein [Chloroflexota bacterium]
MTIDPIEPLIDRFGPALDIELRALVPSVAEHPLYTLLAYHLGWVDTDGRAARLAPGKRIRPLLLLVSCEAAGGDPDAAMPAAAAVELLHNFSLIHDDIQDRSEERRHRPTVWKVWGIAQAINAGDGMHAIAARGVLHCAERGAKAESVLAAAASLHECCLRLVEGQYSDLAFESRDAVSVEEYLRMIDGKTAALIAACVEIGALLAGRRDASLWRAYGRDLGRAFQIADDVLGVWGDNGRTGKPRADDVFKGKRSMPFLLGLEISVGMNRTRLAEIYRLPERSDADVAEAVWLLDRAGVRERANAVATARLADSERTLDSLRMAGPHAATLRAIGQFIVSRDH